MASFCSGWCPLYFVASVTLAVLAITITAHSISKNSDAAITPIAHDLSVNVSRALRLAGFDAMADLLHRSPQFYLPPENSTIFAIQDSAIRNSSLPPSFLKNLLLYHTLTSKVSMDDLLNKTTGTCIPTLFRQKNVAITKIDANRRLLEINHVLISHPDLFVGSQIAIHGVLEPFSFLDPQNLGGGSDFMKSPICSSTSNSMLASEAYESMKTVEWNRIILLLSSNGYVSFSIGLHSVLDEILRDYSMGLDSVTIFAPQDLALLASPSPLLDRVVGLHILPQRFTYRDLIALPARTLLNTFVPDQELENEGIQDFMSGLIISGVEIVAPDVFTSDKFVIHGISRAFTLAELTA
ncbi:hypothetical protein L6164_022266 [Bauhinia variegata]|uniref:Uncharacterized protein n=1 Tax=Bauhinia variegata TaxID=167791 RepID=A0ACB9MEH6_BAUVA|nr:hypothetical protein L6164_022266 [Bauhinia variegata]